MFRIFDIKRTVFSFLILGVSFLFIISGCQPPTSNTPNEEGKTEVLGKYYKEDLQSMAPTTLHQAVLTRDLEEVKKASRFSQELNSKNEKFEDTPLQLAMEIQEAEIAEYLARLPSLDIYHQNKALEGYVFSAAKSGHHRIIQILFERHARFNNWLRGPEYKSLDFTNEKGQRALHVVANYEAAEALRLSSYWNVFRIFDKDHEGLTPLHQAALDQRALVVKWAAERYCQNYDSYFKHSILPDFINQFLASGLKISVEWVRWLSPKMRWDWYNFIAANPFNYPDPEGQTPLHLALKQHSQPSVQAFLSCRFIDLAQKDKQGRHALHHAATAAIGEFTPFLLNTPLIHTWWIQRSTWLNARDTQGQTALHLAAVNSRQNVSYQALVQAGANPAILNKEGQSAEALATASKTFNGHPSRSE